MKPGPGEETWGGDLSDKGKPPLPRRWAESCPGWSAACLNVAVPAASQNSEARHVHPAENLVRHHSLWKHVPRESSSPATLLATQSVPSASHGVLP